MTIDEHLLKRSDESYSENDVTSSSYIYNYTTHATTLHKTKTIVASVVDKKFVGWDIPNFHRRKKAGELLPMTPWFQIEKSGSNTGNKDITYVDSGITYRNYTNDNWGTVGPSTWMLSDEDLHALAPESTHKWVQEAAAKLYSSGWDALTFVAELASVHRMFLNVGKKILTLKLPKNWKKYSDEWLEWRYGWRTLLYDIKDINEAIQSFDDHVDRLSERCGTKYSTTVLTEGTSTDTLYDRDWVIEDKITKSVRGSVIADIKIPKIQINPFVTAWEVIPFSFVLDWFVSVGKAISAASFLTLQTEYSAASGFQVEVQRSFSMAIDYASASGDFISGIDTRNATSINKIERRTPQTVPLTPHFTLNIDSLKIIDLLGLVIQRTRR